MSFSYTGNVDKAVLANYVLDIYEGNGYSTLKYPDLQKRDVDMILVMIKQPQHAIEDLIHWVVIRLWLLKPDWLRSTKEKTLKKRVVKTLLDNPMYLEMVEEFQQDHYDQMLYSKHTQQDLLLTLMTLSELGRPYGLQGLQGLMGMAKNPVNPLGPIVMSAQYFIEEFQIYHGDLYEFLSDLKDCKNTMICF